MPALKLTLVRSPIGYEETQKRTVRALGLTRMRQSVTRPDNEQVRGMVESVKHLVTVETVEGEPTPSAARRRSARG
jgi:large subunit ribosomal protein L30